MAVGEEVRTKLQGRSAEMLTALEDLVNTESFSSDLAATADCARKVADLGSELLGTRPDEIDSEGHIHLRWRFGNNPRVLLIGHFDTVWPLGTVDRWPFSVEGDRASGPGIFDMKGGLVQGLFALSCLDDLDGVEVLFNSDEEIGSRSSIGLIEESGRRARSVLVLEPSQEGALKVARKGVASYDLRVEGRAAHAGLEPEKGANALIELAHQILRIDAVARPGEGTTVTPTLASGGTAPNTVPPQATVHIDVRARSAAELERVNHDLNMLAGVIPGTRLVLERNGTRPPLERSASDKLFRLAAELAGDIGIDELRGVEVGGGSDGNITAGLGTPTLDGLGAIGAGAHAEGEHIIVSAMAERAGLVAALVDRLISPL